MEMQGSRQLAITQQQAWEALNDAEILKACIPGCDSMEATGENSYALANSVKIGPVSAKFKSKITLADIDAPNSYTLNFDGDGGAAGFGKGSARIRLTPQGEGTELAYTVDATVGGKIAQVGQRLIDGVARSMAEKFFKNFDQQMQARYPAAAPAAGAVPAAAAPAPRRHGVPTWVWIVLIIIVVLGIIAAMR